MIITISPNFQPTSISIDFELAIIEEVEQTTYENYII
ncbi:hypothetical protein Mgra_00006117 [Meloidogyne graminicola]|uniref:Uncharacterized protein n=1 Tax=Meloidogyne graminicola TaxID=189291 RepID=A0A8S9ZMQ1_9BILA|nr:hypothetical protein Mgra_00006117 [Meloidogyne graminicola]